MLTCDRRTCRLSLSHTVQKVVSKITQKRVHSVYVFSFFYSHFSTILMVHRDVHSSLIIPHRLVGKSKSKDLGTCYSATCMSQTSD